MATFVIIFFCSRALIFAEIELVIFVFVNSEAEEGGIRKGIHGAAVLLGGTACATLAVDESADATHLQEFVLLGVGDVLVNLRNEFGPHALFDTFQHTERIGDGRFTHMNNFANFKGD